MSFKVENMEEKNMVKLVIEATAEEFEAGLNTAFNKNKNKISVPGFRKGKAPRKMVEKLYGTEIFYEDAANAIIPDAYAKAADESELEIVSQPKINVVQIEAGKPFIFEAVVAVKPEVELGQYKGVEVEKCDTEVTDADVEEELKKVQDPFSAQFFTLNSFSFIDKLVCQHLLLQKLHNIFRFFCKICRPVFNQELLITESPKH